MMEMNEKKRMMMTKKMMAMKKKKQATTVSRNVDDVPVGWQEEVKMERRCRR